MSVLVGLAAVGLALPPETQLRRDWRAAFATQPREFSGVALQVTSGALPAGLRGTPAGALPSRYAKEASGKPGRLNMVLEPGAKEGHLVIGGRSNAF